ncbi:hypothetical protein NMY22_g15155 [Coprinellus aureogranulatus]|nr:hypothetical protein NMY22_g15155 [Coprinellus aureogranulatus]
MLDTPSGTGGLHDSPTSMAIARAIFYNNFMFGTTKADTGASSSLVLNSPEARVTQNGLLGEEFNPFLVHETGLHTAETRDMGIADTIDPSLVWGVGNDTSSTFHLGVEPKCLDAEDARGPESAEAEGRILDDRFIAYCGFFKHDPGRPCPTNQDLFYRLCNYFDRGITKSELRLILRRCKECHRFMYAETRGYHQCDGFKATVDDPYFDIMASFLSHEENCGLSQEDILYLLRRYHSLDLVKELDSCAAKAVMHRFSLAHVCRKAMEEGFDIAFVTDMAKKAAADSSRDVFRGIVLGRGRRAATVGRCWDPSHGCATTC